MEKEKLGKIWFFLGLTLLASFFLGRESGLFFTLTLLKLWESSLGLLLGLSLYFIFVGITFSLPALFLKKGKIFLAILLNCLGFLLGFISLFDFQFLGGILLLSIIFFIGQFLFFKGVQDKSKKFVTFSPSETFSLPLKSFLLTLSLILSLSLFFTLQAQVAREDFSIPQEFFGNLAEPFSQILRKSLEQSLKMQAGEKLEEMVGTKDPEKVLKLLEKEAKETAGEGTLRQQLGLKPEIFDFENSGASQMAKQLQVQIKPFIKYLPFVAALSLFFTLRFLIGLLMIFLSLAVPLVFKILLKLKVFKLIEKQETVKRIGF